MKRNISLLTMLALLVGLMTVLPTSAQAQLPTIPITGSATNSLGQLVNFVGTFTVSSFQVVNGTLQAVGTLAGTLTNTVTQATQDVNQVVSIPVSLLTVTGNCQVLHLTLGPVNLNLLGLMVNLNQVVLDISATAAPGNLLGNLICAVAHLLDNPAAPLNGIAALLNQILGILGRL